MQLVGDDNPRWVPRSVHDSSYENFILTLQRFEKEGLFDSATVYKRGEPDPEPFYSTEQIPTESQDTIHIYKLGEFETPSEAVVFGRAEFSDEILGKFNSEYAIIYNAFQNSSQHYCHMLKSFKQCM